MVVVSYRNKTKYGKDHNHIYLCYTTGFQMETNLKYAVRITMALLPTRCSPLRFCSLCTVFLLFLGASASAKNVVLPLTLDHGLLTSLLVQSSFSGEKRQASLVGQGGGCTQVIISEPWFSSKNGLLQLELKLFIKAGKEFGDSCLMPVSWQGYLELFQKPQIVQNGSAFDLRLKTVESRLLNKERKPAQIAGFLWEFAKPEVYAYLDRVRIDLAPPLDELRTFLAPLFHEEARSATAAMLNSLRVGDVTVQNDGVRGELLAEVDEVFHPQIAEPVSPITPEERQQLVKLWETWDAFLVHLLLTLTAHPLQPEDQQVLIDVLLETRHSMVDALAQAQLEEDLVRVQFLRAWKRLAPVFRRQLYSQPLKNGLGYLAFFTAADALIVFDSMGPTLGIEISEQGFLRLARMLTGKVTELPYNLELDENLRDLFQLLPIEQPPAPPFELEEIELPEEQSPLSSFFDHIITPVNSAELNTIPEFKEILQWRTPKRNHSEYVAKVRTVLAEATDKVLAKEKIPVHLHQMITTLIPAMAWQESCFRQFVTKNKKLTYLLSYNNSSVGLMQINERVWRGFYDRQLLRWNIHYNALAGCEIVELYLNRYVLKKDSWKDTSKNGLLAKVIYSMYNGGPGQYKKFLSREQSGNHYQSDQLFNQKLMWAQKGEWAKVQQCFVGG